jgi:hypothetical protein
MTKPRHAPPARGYLGSFISTGLVKRPKIDYGAATEAQQRRPGIEKLAQEIQRQNPGWSARRCAVEAKARLTEKKA